MTYRDWKHVKKQRSIPRIEVDTEGLNKQSKYTTLLCNAYIFLGLLLVLFYFSAYKFNNKDYCESYSEIVYHAEKDFRFFYILLTMHLGIILFNNQLDTLFSMYLFHFSTRFE
jgi:hypothetical protein